MDVHLVGNGPAREAVVAALGDVECDVVDATPSDLDQATVAVVTDVTGSPTFHEANEATLEGNTPWLAIEVGGIGGTPIDAIDAAVTGLGPSAPCFECLETRVDAATGETDTTGNGPGADRATVRLAGAIAGRELVSLLGGDTSVLGRVVEFPHARRSLLPVPGCRCDSNRDRTIEYEHARVDLDETVSRADRAFDQRVGLVRSLGEVESFPVPYYLATLAETSGFSDSTAAEKAAGVDPDWDAAFVKAVGEALERYCAGVYRDGDFVHASARELERPVRPDAFVRPDDAPSFDPDADHRWVPGTNLSTDEAVHLPASVVHFPPPADEPRFVPSITTGLGLGTSMVDALVAGLTEVLERDATMLSWYSTYEPMELAVDDEGFETLVRRARSEDLSVTPLLLTQDVDVPVVAVAVHRESAWPRFALGSATSLDPVAAARKALIEALQNWMELDALGTTGADEASGEIGRYAAQPGEALDVLDAGGPVPAGSVGPGSVPEGEVLLDALVERVTDAGLTPFAARTTTRDVDDLGFEAVRVVVPNAQPLFTHEPFFGERAEAVPTELGFEARLDRSFHPYP